MANYSKSLEKAQALDSQVKVLLDRLRNVFEEIVEHLVEWSVQI
jgi:hypothetical protein